MKFPLLKNLHRSSNRILSGIFILASLALGTTASFAVPATPHVVDYTQPDGSIIKIRIIGDENSHYVTDLEGNRLQSTDDGWLLPDSTTRSSDLAYRGTPKYLFSGTAFPSFDSPHALVILVSFPDKFFSITNVRDYFHRMLNEEGFSDNGATGSARDFFVDNSNGVFTPQFDVYGPVMMKNQMRYYGANDSQGYDIHPEEMVIEALTALDSTVDFSIYDTDNDGVIDNVYLYYAGYGEADSGIANTIWPHSADIIDFEIGEYYFDGKLLNRYGMSNEVDYGTRRVDGIGTFVHEFSHVLGLPDLYATSYTGAFTPGEYSTLDYAPYNNQGRTPANYSIFERYCLGWANPRIMTESGRYTLEPIHLSNDGIIIPTEKKEEFFLLENRQKQGYDAYIPGHGMLVWHIEFNQIIWDNNIVNNIRNHQYVDLVEADNKQSEITRAGDTFPGSSFATSFTANTSPALRSRMGKQLYVSAINNIVESNGTISFDATLDPTGIDWSGVNEVLSADICPVTSIGQTLTNNGTTIAEIYNVAGIRVATLSPGESASLPSGIYIASTPSSSYKIKN